MRDTDMLKAAGLVVAIIFAALGLSAAAFGQGASGDQYGGGTSVGTTPTVTAQDSAPSPTTVPSAEETAGEVEGQSDADEEPNEGDETDGEGVSTPTTSSGPATPTTGPTSAGAISGAGIDGPPANRVAVLSFGRSSADLENDIREALRRAGLQVLFEGEADDDAVAAFLSSRAAKALSSEGPRAIGKAFGAQLVDPSPTLLAAFPLLFGTDSAFVPAIRAVLTRSKDIGKAAVEFQLGVAEALETAGIPVAYVETSDTDPTFVVDYTKLDVPVVDEVDTDAGKQQLGALMLGEGSTGRTISPDGASAAGTGGGGSDAPAVAGLLAIVGAGVWMLFLGSRRRRLLRR